jgi:hypothetical protein
LSYTKHPLGFWHWCLSAASITRRLLAQSPSFGGDLMPPATNYELALAALVAAAKVRLSSIQVEQAIIGFYPFPTVAAAKADEGFSSSRFR